MPPLLRCDDYTVGWVCALPVELAAAQEMLDDEHKTPNYTTNDTNLYSCGRVGEHNVVIACLPVGHIGTTSAAAVAMQMRTTFPSTRFGLMVGVGGGVPSEEADVRLGDVVVSQPHETHGGVVQYDLGKATASGFIRTGYLNAPPTVLLNAVTHLRANEMRGRGKLLEYLSKLDSLPKFRREAAGSDTLFKAEYNHVGLTSCGNCSTEHTVTREPSRQEVVVHYGTIASGNRVMRSGAERDRISTQLNGVLCFEMEAAGLMNSFPCLVVRGVCDYADSHKNKKWQAYAAGTAAAYAKELLSAIPPAEVIQLRVLEETTRVACKRSIERSSSPPTKRRRLSLISQGPGNADNIVTPDRTPQEQECLDSLSFLEQEYRLDDIHVARDTCEWLSEDPKYQAWTKGTTGLFWIKGDPGAGKSVLMKHSIKKMRERSPNDLVISFFFHGQGTPLQKTLLGLYRALLASMLDRFPQHLTDLAVKFTEREKRYGRFGEPRWEWTEKELQDLLSKVLTNGPYRQPVVIFIDALDECGEGPAKSLLAYFKDLMSQAKDEPARLRICVSSRHYPILALDTIPSAKVEDRNSEDIQRYIAKELRDIRPKSKREQIESEILSRSRGGFQWAVLVTESIVGKNLTGVKAEKLLEELSTCPQTLGKIYEAIFDNVSPTDQHQMTKIFQWVRFAERPLSAQELRDALATDQNMSHRTIFELRAYEGWSDSLADFERHVKHISRGLIRFQSRDIWEQYDPGDEDSDREAQLIHQSVADFLTDKSVNSTHDHGPMTRFAAGPSHFQISRSCLRYMTLRDILGDAHLSRNTLSSRFPLAPYAVQFLFAHIHKVEQEGICQSDLLHVMQWEPTSETMRKLATLWRTLDPDNLDTPMGWPFVEATALHVSVAFGSMSAVNGLLRSGCDKLDSRDPHGNTPLMFAISEGHQNIALALLDQSVERAGPQVQLQRDGQPAETRVPAICAVEVNAENEDGDTALDMAVDQDMDEVILKLVDVGADLRYLGRENALVAHAVSRRNTEFLTLLIEKNLNLGGVVFFALKYQQPQQDHVLEGIISQLLRAGANTARSVELNDVPRLEDIKDGSTHDIDAISLAARRGLTGVIEILLAHGVPVAPRNHRGECPLLIAIKCGHGDAIQMLLSKSPSSVETPDDHGESAFDFAVKICQAEHIKLLLREGTFSDSNSDLKYFLDSARDGAIDIVEIVLQRALLDLECTDERGRLALCLAAQNGHEGIIRRLLDTGRVDVNATSRDGDTPITLAAYNGHEAIVKLLLDSGKVDVNATTRDSSTPLMMAIYNRHEAIVKLLLKTGKANVNAARWDGITPLILAAYSEHEAIVKLLLDTSNIDADARDFYGRTALSWAAEKGHVATVNLLLETARSNAGYETLDRAIQASWVTRNGCLTEDPQPLIDQRRLLVCGDRSDSTDRRSPPTAAWQEYAIAHSQILSGCIHGINLRLFVHPDSKDRTGRTPLSWAAENGHKEVIMQLLATQRVDIQSQDEYGRTPEQFAATNHHLQIVQLLCTNGDCMRVEERERLLPAASNFDIVISRIPSRGD